MREAEVGASAAFNYLSLALYRAKLIRYRVIIQRNLIPDDFGIYKKQNAILELEN